MFSAFPKETGNPLRWFGLPLLIIGLVLISSYFQTGQRDEQQEQPAMEFRLGLPLQPSSALLIVALEQGFFSNNGLQVSVREYPSGKRALHEGLFEGEVDITGSADFPVTLAGMHRKDFRIIASIFSADNVNCIIARRDAGIEVATDLKGKHIATQQGSAVHYFLHLFLLEHGLSEEDVFLSFMKAEELPEALAKGRIDAFFIRAPYIGQAKELLGTNSVVFSAPGLYTQQELLLVREDVIREKPTLSRRILKALLEGEEYIRKNPEKAAVLIAEYLNADPTSIASRWSEFQIRLSLDQSLLVRLEDEARWAIAVKLVESPDVPNYLELIKMDDLRELRANAVTLY